MGILQTIVKLSGEFMNTPREVHAFVNGLFRGLTDRQFFNPTYNGKEKHYWRAGWMMGKTIQIGLILEILGGSP